MTATKEEKAREKSNEDTVQSLQDILDSKKKHERGVEVMLDSALAASIREHEGRLEKLQRRKKNKDHDLADKASTEIGIVEADLEELWDEAEGLAITFTFRDIGRKPFDDLVLAHPATPDQKKRVEELGGGMLEYNVDTFPPALMAATAINPEMTLEEATEIFNDWGAGDVEALFATALMVCRERTSIPLSKRDIAQTDDSDLNSIFALDGE